jgi:hypothetical protein
MDDRSGLCAGYSEGWVLAEVVGFGMMLLGYGGFLAERWDAGLVATR